jgi:PKHD-type hydroxylase
MLRVIRGLLTQEDLTYFREALTHARWEPGLFTAGGQARELKQNLQLRDEDALTSTLSAIIIARLKTCPEFISAVLPLHIYPPKFNCYTNGGFYGDHVDSAVLFSPPNGQPVRSDVSATVFLAPPNEYEGGELIIHSDFASHEIKCHAGDMVIYSSGCLHQVLPVTKGARLASFFWVQSMVRDDKSRENLFHLDQAIQSLTSELGANHENVKQLTCLYHNLLRDWVVV